MAESVEFLLSAPLTKSFKTTVKEIIEHEHEVPVRVPNGSGGMREVMRVSRHTHEEMVPKIVDAPADVVRLAMWQEDLMNRMLMVRYSIGRKTAESYEAAVEDGIVFNGRGWSEAGFAANRPVTDSHVLQAVATVKNWSGVVRAQ